MDAADKHATLLVWHFGVQSLLHLGQPGCQVLGSSVDAVVFLRGSTTVPLHCLILDILATNAKRERPDNLNCLNEEINRSIRALPVRSLPHRETKLPATSSFDTLQLPHASPSHT